MHKYFSNENKLSKINNVATLKMIKDIKKDKINSRWQRKILSFLLKKLELDDFDTSNTDAKISDYLLLKATEFIDDMGNQVTNHYGLYLEYKYSY